ncbi:MAG: putative maltokinase, partial [Terracidiphilus sp.]
SLASAATAAPAAPAQRLQPRESPSAGNPEPRAGVLEARASTAFAATRGTRPLPARAGSAEQSNTSILYGDALILKLFRRLQAGENPDVEIGRFLTEVAGFKHIAPFLGEISITPPGGEKTTVAMLQGLVKNEGDGWEWFLNQLEGHFEGQGLGTRDVGTKDDVGSWEQGSKGASQQVSKPASQRGSTSIAAAGLLGRRTAEMHLALATPTSDPAFRAEPFTAEDLTRDVLRMEEQAASAFSALRARLATLPEATADEAAAVLARRRELLAGARSFGSGQAAGMRIRIHGDYHLGQILRVAAGPAGDFVILDFEGEPARPLAERRRKQSPLKDVAGMIRSFSYAAWFGMDRYRLLHKDEREETLLGRAQEWENSARDAFLSAYWEAMAASGELLPAREQAEAQLAAYMLEKALYELLYELNNRPQWVRIPLAGILCL